MYNNYNPYYGQNRFQMPMYQPMQPVQQVAPSGLQTGQQGGLQGKVVDSIEVAKNQDIPLDGSTSFFPLADNSMIVAKQLGIDGTSKITVFKPENEQKPAPRYVTTEELEKAVDGLDLSELDDIREDIREIKRQLKDLQTKKNKDKEV